MLGRKTKSQANCLCYGSLCVACGVQITTVDEAKTFYPLFGLGANVALIFSGRAVKYFSQVKSQSLQHQDKWTCRTICRVNVELLPATTAFQLQLADASIYL